MSNDPFAAFDEAAKDVAAASGDHRQEAPAEPVREPAPPAPAPTRPEPSPMSEDEMRRLLGLEGQKEVTRSEPAPAETRENERIRDLAAENKLLREERERYIQQQLQQHNPPPPPTPTDPFEGLSDEQREVAELTAPGVQRLLGQFAKQFEPLMEYVNEQQGKEALKSRLEGMNDEVYEEVVREFNSMPPEVQKVYANPVGAEALAARVLLKQKSEQGNQPAAPAANANRAHTLTRQSGMEPAPPREPNPHEWSPQQFEKVLERIKNGGRAGDPTEPDPFLYGAP